LPVCLENRACHTDTFLNKIPHSFNKCRHLRDNHKLAQSNQT